MYVSGFGGCGMSASSNQCEHKTSAGTRQSSCIVTDKDPHTRYHRGEHTIHQCQFERMKSRAALENAIACIYHCNECGAYHVCDGGAQCKLVDTGESVVCILTGSCVGDTGHGTSSVITCGDAATIMNTESYERQAFDNIIRALQVDIGHFFSTASDMDDVQSAVLDGTGGCLKPTIADLIAATFHLCYHLFDEAACAYDIVCSMYIHIIISVYSTRTVYGSLLFKCTKNKRYDAILKRMRQQWMHMLTIEMEPQQNAECSQVTL
uniref:Uncharacterized protein n=1 Tax=Otarine gammaherpesvirus 4 TaxID=2801541 RepID=A0A889IW39_9GAMA|nr:hypothetical protein [Otarine gammaherpesvirus 4]